MNSALLIILILILGGSVMAVKFWLRARYEQARERWLATRKTILLKIMVPKNNEKTPLAAENLFAALHGIFRPDAQFPEYLSFEIAASAKAIEFYVNCPVEYRDFVEGQIYAQYPDVEMHEVTDYARVNLTDLKVAGTEILLNKSDVFPIKTFQNFEVDPLAGITAVLSKVGENDQIWIQNLMRPISDSWQNKGISHVASVRAGTNGNKNFFHLVIKALLDVFRPPPPEPAKPAGPPKLPAIQEQALKAVEEKTAKLGYATKIRVIVLATNATDASAKINSVTGAFKQFNTVNMNGFTVGKIVTDPKVVEEYRLRVFQDEGNIMNIEELASVFHFPNVSVETPNIVWAGAKKGEPPANLPTEGNVSPEELTLFAMTDFRGHRQKFGIKLRDRRQHMYAIGKSGTGKSTMLENMAIDDIRKGRGVAIVDPHGEFINHVLEAIPASRINDVIYFNPADKDYPIGFNLLENVDPSLKNVVASGVVGIFEKIFGEKSWGPRLEYILRNVILALLEYPNATMLSIMRVLVDKNYRKKVIDKVTDPVIRDFFINEYEKYDPKFRTEAIAPIQNKVGQFLSASTIRNIVGQPKSTFDIEEAMNTRKILLLDLSIGKIGEDAAALLGSMMITKVQLAAMRRANIDEQDRVDFYLYVDEFQNFATESFAVILSEARKYHLNLILTHQYIAQMPESVAKAVFGNTGTIVSFRVGASDAVALVKEFEPVFEANDMVNLDNHHIYAKMSIDGVTRPAFSAITLPPYSEKTDNKEKIIRVSREHYSRPRNFVEKKIAEATTDEGPGETSFPSARVDDDPKLKGKAPQVVTHEVEGFRYQGKQDHEGRHWFMQTGKVPESLAPETEKAQVEVSSDQKLTTKVETQPTPPAVETKEVKDTPVESVKKADDPVVVAAPKPKLVQSEKKKEIESKRTDHQASKPTPKAPNVAGPSHSSGKLKLKGEESSKTPSSSPVIQPQSKPSTRGGEIQPLKPNETIILRD